MPRIYGINPILEQLSADAGRIERLHLPKGPIHGQLGRIARIARDAGIRVSYVARNALDRLADGEAHQGVVADVMEFVYADLGDVLNAVSKPRRLLLLDGVQDPRNLGSIVRTAVCAGVDGIIIPKRNAAGMTGVAAKASAGGAAVAKIARVTNMARLIEQLKERNIWTVAVEASGKQEVASLDPALDYAFVFGGEGSGVRRLLRESCDLSAHIPMRGPLDSLNVSVAVGITLFSLLPPVE